MHFGAILVPVDFSPTSEAALRYALRLAPELGARVDVLHVLTPPPFLPLDVALWPGPDERALEELATRLEQLAATARGEASAEVTARIESGEPHDTIVAAAEGVDLVVMGSHGRTGLSHLVLGSVAERTVRFARCPVLVVRRDWHVA